MGREEVYDYYSALNASNRLIDVDCKDSLQTIKQKLLKISKDFVGTYHIEVFKKNENVQSYSVAEVYNPNAQQDAPVYNLWETKATRMQNANLDSIAEYIFDNMPKDVVIPFKYCVVGTDKKAKKLYVKDFDDTTGLSSEIDFDRITKKGVGEILGTFMNNETKTFEVHNVNNADTSDFQEIIELIENPKIKAFAETFIRIIPDYVFSVPLNGSSKDKNASDAENGGLKRHCVNMANIIYAISNLDYYKIKLSKDDVDNMLVACLFSKFLKSGWQDEYEIDSSTHPDYPQREAETIKKMTGILTDKELTVIANLVESHLGTDVDDDETKPQLPTPETDCEALVCLANFFASNENIAIKGKDGFFVFSEDTVHKVNKTVELEENDSDVIMLALDKPIDMELAKSLSIHRTEENIKKIWKEMIAAKKYTPKQRKYIDLASQMSFF